MTGNVTDDTVRMCTVQEKECVQPEKTKDIIANNPIDQKVVELSSSQPYSLVEHSMYRSVFPPQGV
jgi:hypothetical protein